MKLKVPQGHFHSGLRDHPIPDAPWTAPTPLMPRGFVINILRTSCLTTSRTPPPCACPPSCALLARCRAPFSIVARRLLDECPCTLHELCGSVHDQRHQQCKRSSRPMLESADLIASHQTLAHSQGRTLFKPRSQVVARE